MQSGGNLLRIGEMAMSFPVDEIRQIANRHINDFVNREKFAGGGECGGAEGVGENL